MELNPDKMAFKKWCHVIKQEHRLSFENSYVEAMQFYIF
jgi:hypothetical protein